MQHPHLSINRQLKLLNVPRSSFFYRPKHNVNNAFRNEQIKDEMIDIYLKQPFYGVPRLTAELKRRGWKINHKKVSRLQKLAGLKTVYPRPHFNTSEPDLEHKKFPYFLRGIKIGHTNHVWSTDITYTAVDGHRAYVIAILDWFSRKVLAYNVVNTMDAYHCVETLHKALETYGRPEIFNSDQGSQFTSNEFISELETRGITISMDGRGVV